MIVKLQWMPKKSTEAPFVVDVPDVFKQAFVMEKDSKRFPKTGGWGYGVFNYDAESDISNNVGPVKLFLNTLLSFHLKELFSFVLFCFVFFPASTTTARL